jgi:NADH:ubiquinone oxidoreductase subunit E
VSESEEQRQAPGESGTPPVPDAGTPPTDQRSHDRSAGPDAGVGTASISEPADVPDELRQEVERLISLYPEKRSAAMPALFAIQARYGYCSPEGIEQVATVMEVDPAYLESVASFYDLLHLEPVGQHRVLVCTNISCWMRGADELLDSFCEAAGADRERAGHGGVLNSAGDVFVSGFECLGACDIAPMASIDERYYGPIELDEVATVLEQLRGGSAVLPDKALAKRPAAGGPEPDPDPRVAEVE